MRVLVTGTDGYIGSILAGLLLENDYDVLGVDAGFYKDGWLYPSGLQSPQTLQMDIRRLTLNEMDGIDAVVHLAELSNDPLSQFSPELTYSINHQGSLHVARLAKQAGIKRFIYASSCSVYGVAAQSEMTETSPLNPQTVYAECKTLVERDVSAIADDFFSPVFLRNATVFGASPRMRFDVVVNNLSGLAWTQKAIRMSSDGTPWRPLVHITDVCQAVRLALEADRDVIHNQILNVGDTRLNVQVSEIAEIVGTVFPDCTVSFGSQGADNRSYQVNFDKIRAVLPDFQCQWTVEDGTRQLHDIFGQIALTSEQFESRHYTRLLQLQHLLQTGQLDADLFWKHPA